MNGKNKYSGKNFRTTQFLHFIEIINNGYAIPQTWKINMRNG